MHECEMDKKLAIMWKGWRSNYENLVKNKPQQEAWLRSEVQFISGLVYRAAQVNITSASRLLQIGSGPVDVVDFFQCAEKHAIDPLADNYKELYGEFQDKKVRYIRGLGEELPYANDYFDFVVVRNALDHVYDPAKTLTQIHRVLKADGVLYIWIYLYDWWSSIGIRAGNAILGLFAPEPWAFTERRIKSLMGRQGFTLCYPLCIEERGERQGPPGSFKYWVSRTFFNYPAKHPMGFCCVARPIKD